ncbi:MAG: hypothetical protein R3F19_02020 [Verrucomicrobiales bacterium]
MRPGLPMNAPPAVETAASTQPYTETESPVIHEDFVFSCPACCQTLSIAAASAGEAIDCSACGTAVVSPDPLRGEPAILFSELLQRMGIAPMPANDPIAQEAPIAHRQIAEFQLNPVKEETPGIPVMPDPMAWLNDEQPAAQPGNINREPLWPIDDSEAKAATAPPSTGPEENAARPSFKVADFLQTPAPKREAPSEIPQPTPAAYGASVTSKFRKQGDRRSTPLRIARALPRTSTVPRRSFTSTEIATAAVAVIAVGAASYALFLSPNKDSKVDDSLVQPKTAVVTQTDDDPPSAQASDAIAIRANTPAPDVNGFEIDRVLQDVSPPVHAEEQPAEPQAMQEEQAQPQTNPKIVNFEKSRNALRAFCEATTPDELLKYVLKPEVHEASVRSYFEKNGPGCFQLRELIHGQTSLSKEDGRYWSSFLVQTNKNPRGFTVTVQETDTGPRLSWPAFIQHHDSLFEDYLTNNPPSLKSTAQISAADTVSIPTLQIQRSFTASASAVQTHPEAK